MNGVPQISSLVQPVWRVYLSFHIYRYQQEKYRNCAKKEQKYYLIIPVDPYSILYFIHKSMSMKKLINFFSFYQLMDYIVHIFSGSLPFPISSPSCDRSKLLDMMHTHFISIIWNSESLIHTFNCYLPYSHVRYVPYSVQTYKTINNCEVQINMNEMTIQGNLLRNHNQMLTRKSDSCLYILIQYQSTNSSFKIQKTFSCEIQFDSVRIGINAKRL